VDIIVKFIDVATKQLGGRKLGLSHLVRQTPCGARHIRSRDSGFALEAVRIVEKLGAKLPEQRPTKRTSLWQAGHTQTKSQRYSSADMIDLVYCSLLNE
jgi:hypothetical protein